MKLNPSKIWLPALVLDLTGGWLALSTFLQRRALGEDITWEAMANPGALSKAHAILGNNCAACHANDQAPLHRQPTAFQADMQNCAECPTEHEGVNRRRPPMNHDALARVLRRQVDSDAATGDTTALATRAKLATWMEGGAAPSMLPAGHPNRTAGESAPNCFACQANQDRHREMFGKNCFECHTTTAWTITRFRHPPPTSMSCVQCHKAPPSHCMGEFKVISMKVAGQPHAQVSECYKCRQTTSWNDIAGVGWYKHH